MFRQLARRPELKAFVAREIGPGANVATDAQIESYTRQTAVTAHHPSGTCKMGVDTDPAAVVARFSPVAPDGRLCRAHVITGA